MLSVPQLTQVVKAAPMPLYVKEQILDQVLGHHDDLHAPKQGALKSVTPMHERVDAARQIGAFDFQRTLPSGDLVYLYCKQGEPAYELCVREGRPFRCTCPIFRVESARDPDYDCKHCLLFLQGEHAEHLIAEAARLAGEWETAWAYHKLGRITDTECSAAYRRFDAARAAMRKVVCP